MLLSSSSPLVDGAYSLIWLRGADCEGCTIATLGDASAGGLEQLIGTPAPGMPQVLLIHPLLSLESGEAFNARLIDCVSGRAGRFGLIVESAVIPRVGREGWFDCLGEYAGQPVSAAAWLDMLAPSADFITAVGDCAVWGGPHSIGINPTSSMGVSMWLGESYRSRLGLPVINLPGCAAPHGVLSVVRALVACAIGAGAPPPLDEFNRPAALYAAVWQGALALWEY